MAKKHTPAKATEKATAKTATTKAAQAATPEKETASKAPAATAKTSTRAAPKAEKTAKPKKETTPKKGAAKREPTDAEISQRAYELFLERGGTHGYHYEDWLKAERELRGNKR